MKSEYGTYVLILRCSSKDKIQIGRWREIDIESGYYLYVGSAFGPGGIKARVSRHHREEKARHWHIDYLREHTNLLVAWYSYEPHKLEHRWAKALSELSDMESIPGFGCSDCQCHSHLFNTAKQPDLEQFSNAVGGNIESCLFTGLDASDE